MHFAELIWKNLCRRPARSLLTAAGVTIATAAVMSLLSVAGALKHRSAEVYSSREVDVVVIRAGVTERLTSNLNEDLGQRLAALPGVADVAPALSDMVLIHDEGVIGVPLCGWRLDSFLFDLLKLADGRQLRADDSHGLLLGSVLAESLSKRPGDELEIEGVPFRILGVFRSVNVWENGSAIVLLADMQELDGSAGAGHGVSDPHAAGLAGREPPKICADRSSSLMMPAAGGWDFRRCPRMSTSPAMPASPWCTPWPGSRRRLRW